MGITNFFTTKPTLKATNTSSSETESMMNYFQPPQNDIMKANIPGFLYKPPFGYPRKINVPHLRDIAKTPYVFSIIKTLADEAAGTKWSVKVRKEFVGDEEAQKLSEDATLFLNNPNGNDESFEMIQKALIKDLLELDSGVLVKVFNEKNELSQIFARDGGSFLKNPDIYGYMGNRANFIPPITSDINSLNDKQYQSAYSSAAYYQYGWTTGGKPIPFGKREIMYVIHNPKTDSIYGSSPMEILTNTLYMLIYGQQYNLDYYMNGNVADGIVHLPNADKNTAKSFSQRLMAKFKKVDSLDNKVRVGHQYPIWAGEQAPSIIPFSVSAKDMQILDQQKWFIKLVWSVFGVTPDEMGFTEDSNRATGIAQVEVHKRKAIQPLLETLQYHYTTQILTEFDPMGRLEFIYDDYDINTEMKKLDLYRKELDLGIKTSEMIAKEEGIDIKELQTSKEDELTFIKQSGTIELPNEKTDKVISTDNDKTIEEDAEQDMIDKQESNIKAFKYEVGDTVKVIEDNPGYTGIVGTIETVETNKNNEFVYKLRFDDQTFIKVFSEEIKCVDKQTLDYYSEEEKVYSNIKSFKFEVGESVKVVKDNPGYTGIIGTIDEIEQNKNKENVYIIRFDDKTYIKVFEDEIKSITRNKIKINTVEDTE